MNNAQTTRGEMEGRWTGQARDKILYFTVVCWGAAKDPVRKLTHGSGERSKLLLSRWGGSSWCSTVICLSWKLCKLKITPKLRSFVICRYTTFPRHVFVRSAAFRRRTTASVIIITWLARGGGPRKSLGRPTNYGEYTLSPSKWKTCV